MRELDLAHIQRYAILYLHIASQSILVPIISPSERSLENNSAPGCTAVTASLVYVAATLLARVAAPGVLAQLPGLRPPITSIVAHLPATVMRAPRGPLDSSCGSCVLFEMVASTDTDAWGYAATAAASLCSRWSYRETQFSDNCLSSPRPSDRWN